MKHLLITLLVVFLLAVSITACSPAAGNSGSSSRSSSVAPPEQTEYLEEIPAEYYKESDQPGRVIQVNYESRDYTGSDAAITKPAWVYLPYG